MYSIRRTSDRGIDCFNPVGWFNPKWNNNSWKGGIRVSDRVFKINKQAKQMDWNGSFSVWEVRYVCVVVLVVGDEMFICGQGTGIYAATRD